MRISTVYLMMVIFGHEQANLSCIRTVYYTLYRTSAIVMHVCLFLKFMIIMQLLAGKLCIQIFIHCKGQFNIYCTGRDWGETLHLQYFSLPPLRQGEFSKPPPRSNQENIFGDPPLVTLLKLKLTNLQRNMSGKPGR